MWRLGRECRCLFGLCAVRLAGAVGERSRALWRVWGAEAGGVWAALGLVWATYFFSVICMIQGM